MYKVGDNIKYYNEKFYRNLVVTEDCGYYVKCTWEVYKQRTRNSEEGFYFEKNIEIPYITIKGKEKITDKNYHVKSHWDDIIVSEKNLYTHFKRIYE